MRARRAQSADVDARASSRRDDRARSGASSWSSVGCVRLWRFAPESVCFMLSPVALAIVFWYSLAKRYTAYTQLFLGLAMAVAPVGGWLAAGGRTGPGTMAARSGHRSLGRRLRHPVCLPGPRFRSRPWAAVDPDALRRAALHSLVAPDACGHSCGDGGPVARGDLPPFYLVGVVIVAVLLTYEQSLVSDEDLSQVKKAFDLNGYVDSSTSS